MALLFTTEVSLVVAASLREWWLVLRKRKPAQVHEAPYVETAFASGD